MHKVVGIVSVIILLGLGVWWLVIVPGLNQPAPIPADPDGQIATSTDATSQWQWVFDEAGTEKASGAPITRVALRNGETSYLVGTFTGTCMDMRTSSWKLHEDEAELAGAVCWWAGGGNEIGVFSEDGVAAVKVGELDEGDAENAPFRGNFTTLFTIDFGFIRSLATSTTAIAFDDARWLTDAVGEEAAIAAGICTEETRAECLPNDFYILDKIKKTENLPLAPNVIVYMLTWHSETQGVKRETIPLRTFTTLINDPLQHWNQVPYNVTVQDGQVIMIEEVYVP
jgi:hypothetical protein